MSGVGSSGFWGKRQVDVVEEIGAKIKSNMNLTCRQLRDHPYFEVWGKQIKI